MPSDWYFAKAGKKEGPVSIDDLKQLAQQGQLQPADHVWKHGTPAWVPASTVDGLFENEPPPLPPSAAGQGSATDSSSVMKFFRWCCDHAIILFSMLLAVSILLTGSYPSPVGHIGGLLLLLSLTALIAAVSSIQVDKYNAAHGLPTAKDRRDSSLFEWCYNRPVRCFGMLTAFSIYFTGYYPSVVGQIGGALLLLSLAGLVVSGCAALYKVGFFSQTTHTSSHSKEIDAETPPSMPQPDEKPVAPEPRQTSGGGFFASLFGWLSGYKCPRCGKYSGKELHRECVHKEQGVVGRTLSDGRREQAWANVYLFDVHLQCQSCKYPWVIQEQKQNLA